MAQIRAAALRQGLLLVFLLAGSHSAIGGQGCSQCREAVGQTPARTQTAYRRGVALLVIAGSGVFAGSLFFSKRFR